MEILQTDKRRFILIGSNQPNVDLANIPFVKEVYATFNGQVSLHLECEKDNEQKVIDNLPAWIGKEMEVHKSHRHVFLQAKNNQSINT